MPSGHTAIAFSVVTAVAFISENTLIITLCLLLAILVAQSRIESGFHDLFQVIMGAVLGICITLLIFQTIY
jgi:diacylglycerol kinase (ATP)